jgi:hypothetical protein
MGVLRTAADLDVVAGKMRSFEWFWEVSGEMPGLDAFEALDKRAREEIITVFRHWGELTLGSRMSQSRLNREHDVPIILAAKAKRHRFTVFHGDRDVWIVHGYYAKQKAKLDRAGRVAIAKAVRAKLDYDERVQAGDYYGRR